MSEINRMQSISNIVYNSTQSNLIIQDKIIDSLIGILENYNKENPSYQIEIKDWRNRK